MHRISRACCGRPLPAGSRAGAQLCEDCQTHPQTVANRLIRQAREGDANLSGISRYTLLRELGRGGMGAVYLAQDGATGGLVALKVMLPKIAADAEARARFLREAKVTSELRHPNIVAVHDVGNAAGAFCLTTESCPHGSLDQLARRHGGPLPLGMALPLALQAMDGLAHAHGRGIVHRDLSPHNISLGDDDGVPVAKVAVTNPDAHAAAGQVLGEDPGDAVDGAHVMAGAHVRVQAEGDPGPGLADEALLVARGPEHLRQRALDGQVGVPAQVPDPVDNAHAAPAEDPGHLVEIQDPVADGPLSPDHASTMSPMPPATGELRSGERPRRGAAGAGRRRG